MKKIFYSNGKLINATQTQDIVGAKIRFGASSIDKRTVEGVDVPFEPPPEEYPYRCSHCQYEMKVNEAIIDVESRI